MTTYIGIDPGVRACGVAVVSDGALTHASYVRGSQDLDVVSRLSRLVSRYPSAVVGIEFPRTYAGRARRGDANDLLELAYVVGRLVEAIESTHALRVRVDAWKRGLPTEVLAAQLGRSPPVGLSEDNVIDAIALARWLALWTKRNTSKNIRDFKLL